MHLSAHNMEIPKGIVYASRRINPIPSFSSQLPPYFNFGHPRDLVQGWVVVLSVLQTIWLPEEAETETQATDWVYMLSDDTGLAAGLMMISESHPSVCLGSLTRIIPFEDYDALGQQSLRAAEGLYPLDWEAVLPAAQIGNVMFPQDVIVDEDTDTQDKEQQDLAARAVPGPPPVMETPPAKKRKSNKKDDEAEPAVPEAKPKAKPKAAKPKASVNAPADSTPPTPTTPSAAKPSSLKARLGLASGLRK